MSFKQEIRQLFAKGHEQYLRNVSVDCIIFGFHEGDLKVLLLKANYTAGYALPGGFIGREEILNQRQ